jgi:hypothetical protein
MTTVSLHSGGNASSTSLAVRPETYDEPGIPDSDRAKDALEEL